MIEGAFFIHHSLAKVNRQLALSLSSLGIDVRIAPYEKPGARDRAVDGFEALTKLAKKKVGKPDLIIRHGFPPNLCPGEVPIILMQPWEFFVAPEEWVRFVNEHAAGLWVNSSFTRAAYVRSGVDPRKVRVLPLGVDGSALSPKTAADPELAAHPEFKFLFVGGSITRKGIDILLNAFTQEFRKGEAVRLVVKDTGTQHVYRHNNWGEELGRLASNLTGPKVTYIARDVSEAQLAGIYRACDCLVAPYRAEGFCLPVLEAMACGLPVIVTSGGPTDDLVLHGCGWKAGASIANIDQLAGLESPMPQAWLEPSVPDLRSAMREAFEGRATVTKDFGARAARIASENWKWSDIAPLYAGRIQQIVGSNQGGARMAKDPKISLCMIVRDEERVLDACLSSARPYVDEIVVVDTGSKDKTKEIASKYADKVLDFAWCNDFSAARNVSLSHATGDWIFWMDADDTLPPETGQAIRSAVSHADEGVTGFVIPIQFVETSEPGAVRVDHVKLFRAGEDMRFEGRIHEQILPSCRRRGGDIVRLNVVILHSGYDTSVDGQAKKRVRDNTILDLELIERPNHPFVLFNVGMTRHFEGRHKEAVKYLKRCLAAADPNESIVRKAYSLLAVSLSELGKKDEALATVRKGLEIVPEDPELHFRAGYLLSDEGRLEEALSHYEQVTKADVDGFFSSIDMGIITYKTYFNMGNICRNLGRFDEAKHWFWTSIKKAPQFLPSAFSLFDSCIEHGDLDTAFFVLEKVQQVEGRSENWAKMVDRHAEAAGGQEASLKVLRQLSDGSPESRSLRLVLARKLLAKGKEEEAVPVLVELAEAGSAEANYLLGVHHIRLGAFDKALGLMRQALVLNPAHEATKEQIVNLERLIGEQGKGK